MALYKLTVKREKISDEQLEAYSSADDVYRLVKDEAASYDREHFNALYLNSRNQLLGIETVSIGTINKAAIYPRDIIKSALLLQATALILMHNHPSGSLEPSPEDKNITRLIMRAARLFGIKVLDHLVIGEGGYYSFSSKGLIDQYEADLLMAENKQNAINSIIS